jgi:hypothetical protein
LAWNWAEFIDGPPPWAPALSCYSVACEVWKDVRTRAAYDLAADSRT